MNLILLGPPGAGKGTQAEKICKRFRMAHISTGDMLRAELHAETALGLAAKAFMDAGELVPDSVIIDMARYRIERPDCAPGYLLDGFPRTVAQADALAEFARIDAVINIEVPFDKLIDRICGRRVCTGCGKAFHTSVYAEDACGECGGVLYQREDDKPETVTNRLDVYRKNTAPLIAYYREKGLLYDVDGDRPAEDVFEAIVQLMEAL